MAAAIENLPDVFPADAGLLLQSRQLTKRGHRTVTGPLGRANRLLKRPVLLDDTFLLAAVRLQKHMGILRNHHHSGTDPPTPQEGGLDYTAISGTCPT